MTEHTRFGPAGVPPMFRLMGAKTPDVPKLLREEGLDAFEYQAVQWGQKPQMKQADAEKLGEEARKNDVRLSMHGSYFVNLAGKRDVVEASKRRQLRVQPLPTGWERTLWYFTRVFMDASKKTMLSKLALMP